MTVPYYHRQLLHFSDGNFIRQNFYIKCCIRMFTRFLFALCYLVCLLNVVYGLVLDVVYSIVILYRIMYPLS